MAFLYLIILNLLIYFFNWIKNIPLLNNLFISLIRLKKYRCNLIYTYGIHDWRIIWSSNMKVGLSGIWTHDHWIPFRRFIWLSYQAKSSTLIQSQLCTAAPISSFAQFPIPFRLLPSSVATFILIEIFLR